MLAPVESTSVSERAAERYRLLVEQLREELGGQYGWQAEVAKRLGVHRSYVNQIASGARRSVGKKAVHRAAEALNLRTEFFFAPMEREPHYTEFLAGLGGMLEVGFDANSSAYASDICHLVPLARSFLLQRADKKEDMEGANALFVGVMNMHHVQIALMGIRERRPDQRLMHGEMLARLILRACGVPDPDM